MLKADSPYSGRCVVMTTKHAKSVAVAPPFADILGASVAEYPLDTDLLGTFSGEVECEASALDCARRKCEWGVNVLNADYGIASEGSFGPHHGIPFVPAGREILYFIDRKRGFHLHVRATSEQTNYRKQAVDSFEALQKFAGRAQFPSHALVIRPNCWQPGQPLFKGIQTFHDLENAFQQSLRQSPDGVTWVETDMRAHLNPTRMRAIGILARELAERLTVECPSCGCPGWGRVNAEKGVVGHHCVDRSSSSSSVQG